MFKDVKKKAELKGKLLKEKGNEAKNASLNIGSKVLESAKSVGDAASEIATGAVETASTVVTNAGKVATGAINSLIIKIATKIVVKSMKKASQKGTGFIYDDKKYQGFINKTWEILPLPVRLVGKETLNFNDTMFFLRNSIFGTDNKELTVNKEDEGLIKKSIKAMFK